MKAIHLLLVLGCLVLGNTAAQAVAVLNLSGQPNINVTATGQDLFYQPVSAKTNLVHGVTNGVIVEKSTTTNFTIDATSLLSLLENSFNTNFPAGTQLLLSGSRGYYFFVVTNDTDTNVSLPVYQVVSSVGFSTIHSGFESEMITNQLISSGNDTEALTSAFSFQYDDSAKTTGDGTHTVFFWNCLIESKASSNLATGALTENVAMTLTGAGEIRGQSRNVFSGTIRAKLTGHKPVF